MTEQALIEACKRENPRAQKKLYDRYAPMAMGVCMRYVRHREDAEDVMVEALFKVLTHIQQYKGDGSFEGWIRRIVVNESLMFLRRRHNFNMTVELDQVKEPGVPVGIVSKLAAEDILSLMDELPTGYRTVFNLYVIEGYKHREIAEMLGISINTSKSQLILAKKRMQELLDKVDYPGVRKA